MFPPDRWCRIEWLFVPPPLAVVVFARLLLPTLDRKCSPWFADRFKEQGRNESKRREFLDAHHYPGKRWHEQESRNTKRKRVCENQDQSNDVANCPIRTSKPRKPPSQHHTRERTKQGNRSSKPEIHACSCARPDRCIPSSRNRDEFIVFAGLGAQSRTACSAGYGREIEAEYGRELMQCKSLARETRSGRLS